MPREAFFKIKEEKRKQILEASIKEFIMKNPADISINQIIKDADISRGSFYLYFENVEDLYNYLLKTVRTAIVEAVKVLLTNENTIFEVALKLFDRFVELTDTNAVFTKKDVVERICKELTPPMIMYFVQGFDEENPYIFTKVKDFKKLNIKSAEDYQIMLEIIIAYTVEKVCEIYVKYTSVKEARHNLERMFEYLKKSFYK